jgi:hypothetical protein
MYAYRTIWFRLKDRREMIDDDDAIHLLIPPLDTRHYNPLFVDSERALERQDVTQTIQLVKVQDLRPATDASIRARRLRR